MENGNNISGIAGLFSRNPIGAAIGLLVAGATAMFGIMQGTVTTAREGEVQARKDLKECVETTDNLQNTMITNAYLSRENENLKEKLEKSTEVFDSIAVTNLKSRTEPALRKLKKYNR